MRLVIAVSGPVAVGKSQFIEQLQARLGAKRVSTRTLIQKLMPHVPSEREALQEAGDELDRTTEGRWVADALGQLASTPDRSAIVIVDSVRIRNQVSGLRALFPNAVLHIHLTAPDDVLRHRYMERIGNQSANVTEPQTYDEVRNNSTERQVGTLAGIADVTIDNSSITAEQAAEKAMQHLDAFLNRP